MGEWITDRRPTKADADGYGLVWITEHGRVVPCTYNGIAEGTAWMPIERPEPYVKPKRFVVKRMIAIYSDLEACGYCVHSNIGRVFAKDIPTREAAERIAAIYEEVMP